MISLTATCVICSNSFEARTSYGLCPSCWSRDRLREWDRVQSAIRHAERHRLTVALTLTQWLATTSAFQGLCAYCLSVPYSQIEMVDPTAGLIWSNVVPICKPCQAHRQYGWQNAVERVLNYLAEFEDAGDEEDGEVCEEDEFQQVVETETCTFDDIFPGIGNWYLEHYGPHGRREGGA